MSSNSLDLGCGEKPKNPYGAKIVYGIDLQERPEHNIRCADLATENIPFPNEHFDFVTAYDFLEHIPKVIYAPKRRNAFVELMNEIYRVLRPNGIFFSSTPVFPHSAAWRDPTHVNIMTEETFELYFDDKNRSAQVYGFNGAFRILNKNWSEHRHNINVEMQKVKL
jgi:SAM-dependent methyltransferase